MTVPRLDQHSEEAVMTDRPIVMAVASYRSKAAAEADFRALWPDEPDGTPRPIGAALVEKGANGRLTIDRHRCSQEPAECGGPVLGSALVAVAAPVGIRLLVTFVNSAAVLGGVGAITDHLWNSLPKDLLRQMSELLETAQAALVVVAADQTNETIEARLAGADEKVVAVTCADFERDYADGVDEATGSTRVIHRG